MNIFFIAHIQALFNSLARYHQVSVDLSLHVSHRCIKLSGSKVKMQFIYLLCASSNFNLYCKPTRFTQEKERWEVETSPASSELGGNSCWAGA